MAAFVDVLLRGVALSGQAIAIGGVLFALLLHWSVPAPGDGQGRPPLPTRIWSLISVGAAAVALAQCLSLAVLVASLGPDAGWPPWRLSTTQYLWASALRVLASGALVAGAAVVRRRPRPGPWWSVLVGSALALAISAAWTSHAAARLEHRGLLLTLDALHQLAASAWIGGLFHLMLAALRGVPDRWPLALLRRFSALALAAVAILIAAGVGLLLAYVDGVRALLGTAYGIMVLTKVVILGALLLLGAANFFAIRRLPRARSMSPVRLRRFVEVEFGLGITVFFAAASLTSLPPAVDVVADRATLSEVGTRFTPRWPTLTSPPIDALPIGDRNAPRTAEDRAWSEYNHHISGLFVLGMGLLALLQGSGTAHWARHWPLVFLGLAAFMLVRNDPGAWPLGPRGFWESMGDPAVLQHRVFVLLVVAFGLFEWMVRAGRLSSSRCALIFPLLCAIGGGLLLTHAHASLDAKSEFLMEVTHAPLGVLGMLVGWARWLELRLASLDDRLPGRLSASAMAAIGVLLLLYRES
ncbi:MAG: CopD family protein [Candidatus Rokubacteria bacterium]|nr:CopD family protein [Candidatus Rokubacteria bacterium]